MTSMLQSFSACSGPIQRLLGHLAVSVISAFCKEFYLKNAYYLAEELADDRALFG